MIQAMEGLGRETSPNKGETSPNKGETSPNKGETSVRRPGPTKGGARIVDVLAVPAVGAGRCLTPSYAP